MINGEPGHERCQLVVDKARKGELEIWSSTLALAEAYKKRNCGSMDAEKDVIFEDYITQDFVKLVQVDQDIAVQARRLCRLHDGLKKANDGVHLASAIFANVDELHTTDRNDLLPLNGQVYREDGMLLMICEPPPAQPGENISLFMSPE